MFIGMLIRHQLTTFNPDCEFRVSYFSDVRGVRWDIEHGYVSAINSMRAIAAVNGNVNLTSIVDSVMP